MEDGQSTLLQLVDKFVVDYLDFDFFCLFLPLNFKPYFVMSSKVITEDMLKSSDSDSVKNPNISVVISNYPLSNGGYLVSFNQEEPGGSFKSYNPPSGCGFLKFSTYLDCSSVFLPKGCYYLFDSQLAGFIKALSLGASTFEMKLLPASAQMQSMILVQIDEKSLFQYEQEEEDKR